MSPTQIILTIPEASPSLNEFVGRGHWSSYTACCKHWATLVMVAKCQANHAGSPLLEHARIKVDRFSPRKLDEDNLFGGLKPLIDALKDNAIIRNDSPEDIEIDKPEQHMGRPARTIIHILELIEWKKPLTPSTPIPARIAASTTSCQEP